jgi:GMP synthase (glutamine-hydrolysing)
MPKPILILQIRPEDDTSDNEFASILRYARLEARDVRRLRIEHTGIPEDLRLDDYCAVIVGGSPFDISTPQESKSAIQDKIERDFNRLFDDLVARDFPFLGACSGNSLLGAYLGASISTRYGEPVGLAMLDLTEAGKRDPLLAGLPDRIAVLLGHKEACDATPAGATLLMTGARCPVQMFRVGQNVYATQFHPEGDAEGFTLRIHAYSHHGYFEPHDAERLIEAVSAQQTPHAQEILKRFVERYRGASHFEPGPR